MALHVHVPVVCNGLLTGVAQCSSLSLWILSRIVCSLVVSSFLTLCCLVWIPFWLHTCVGLFGCFIFVQQSVTQPL